MAELVVGLNPKILRWARERAGLSIEDVAKSLSPKSYKKKIESIYEWEAGESAPTYVQLEKLSYTIFKRPLALFFFPEIPEEADLNKSFRTLPQFEIDKLSADTRFALRQAEAKQLTLLELCDGKNPIEKHIYRDLKITHKMSVLRIAKEVRDFLEVDIETQVSWRNSAEAIRSWRNAVENSGIFVFERSFKQPGISGFCLVHSEFPVIYLNNSTAASRQIFTLFHELAHVLLSTNSITIQDNSFIDSLTGSARAIEQFCNRFAAEFLVPSDDFARVLNPNLLDDEQFSLLAKRYSVSKEVILRKILDMDLVDQEYYEFKTDQWYREYLGYLKKLKEKRKKTPAKIYYPTLAAYLGPSYLSLAFKKYYAGKIGIERLAEVLDIKISGVSGLEDIVVKGSISQ